MFVPLSDTNGGRRRLSLLLFSGNAILYAMRVNFSVAIVAMVGKRKESSLQILHSDDSCPYIDVVLPASKTEATTSSVGEFDWDEQTQGLVLGSFFWGYTLTNLLGGVMAEWFGGRLVYGGGLLITALLTVVSPLAAHHSTTAFIIIRVLEGMTEGVTFPALNVLMSRWVPAASRASFLSNALSGCALGTVITMCVSGWLCSTSAGWPSVFYLFGGLGVLLSVLWFALVTDEPPQPAGISASAMSKPTLIPWREMLTSPAFMCVVAAHTAANWGFYCLLTEMPSYLAHVLHFDVHTNGLVSSLPYLCKWGMLLTYPVWLDSAVQRKQLSVRTARRMSAFIGLVVPGLLLASIQLAGCNRMLVVLLLCLAVGISGADHSGPLCAFQELAPNYAGVLTGISNTVATLPGFLAPQVTGYLTEDQSLSSWRRVFLLATAVYLLGAALYLTFMSVSVQPWNSSDTTLADRKKKQDSVPLLAENGHTSKA